MPFPFLAGIGLLGWIGIGTGVIAALAATGAIIGENKKAEGRARQEAERNASFERLEVASKKAEEVKTRLEALARKYGEKIPEDIKKKFLLKLSETVGELNGHLSCLEDRNEADMPARRAALTVAKNLRDELVELQKKCGLKK